MTKRLHTTVPVQALLITLIAVTPALGQGAQCCGHCMMNDTAHASDMQVFHQLFDHRTEITRQVVVRPDGVETVTESVNPEVTGLLQRHVTSMLARVKEGRPIHRRDPLFAELFRYADQINARHELTAGGVRVIETSAGSLRGQAVTGTCGSRQCVYQEWPFGDDEEPSAAVPSVALTEVRRWAITVCDGARPREREESRCRR